MKNQHPSQADIILRALQLAAQRGHPWTPMPDLWRCSGAMAVHSRIAELRRRGIAIENRIEADADGRKSSFYRLQSANACPKAA